MSNWLGFSLTPDFRIDDDDEEEVKNYERRNEAAENTPVSVMPLSTNRSLCMMDPFPRCEPTEGISTDLLRFSTANSCVKREVDTVILFLFFKNRLLEV